jgi:hypothetical protein
VPLVYFGRPGALVSLPWPRGDMEKPYDREVFDFPTGAGQHAVSLLAQGSRTFTVAWNALHIDTFNTIAEYWYGSNGAGPWVLADPSAPNLLLPNQSAATGLLNDMTGITTLTNVAAMGTLFTNSDAAHIHRTRGRRSIRWQFPVAPSGPATMVFSSPYRNWYGIPVVQGLPYTWSIWVKPDGVVDSSITLAAKLQWLDAAGTQVFENSSGDIVVGSWTRLTMTNNPHASAVYVRPVLAPVSASVTVGASVYADEPLLEQDSVANNWAPGTGVRPVEILSFTEGVPFEARFRKGVTMTLRELAI